MHISSEYEDQVIAQIGCRTWCGVDEAGRGPLAGPVFAAAVILPSGFEHDDLNDSKLLSEKKREELFEIICADSIYGIASSSVEEIEKYNILGATIIAMNRAILQLIPQPDHALIDGNRNKGIIINSTCVVKGDAKCPSIAAASILAKVSRDRYMCELAKQYPDYGFDRNKGYGTKEHYLMINRFGPSPVHRPSFLRKMH